MLEQQESFKVGEWAHAVGDYFCVACDRRGVASIVHVDQAAAFPCCLECTSRGREEVDQLWVRVEDRESWRQRERTRWREVWRSST